MIIGECVFTGCVVEGYTLVEGRGSQPPGHAPAPGLEAALRRDFKASIINQFNSKPSLGNEVM